MKSFRFKTVSIKNTILSQWNTQILRKHPVTTNKIKHKNIGTYVSQRLVFNWIYNVRYRDFRYIISVYCKKILFHVQLLFSADFSKPRKSSTANNTKHVYYLQSFFLIWQNTKHWCSKALWVTTHNFFCTRKTEVLE